MAATQPVRCQRVLLLDMRSWVSHIGSAAYEAMLHGVLGKTMRCKVCNGPHQRCLDGEQPVASGEDVTLG